MLKDQPPITCFSIDSNLEGETEFHPCWIFGAVHMTKHRPEVPRSHPITFLHYGDHSDQVNAVPKTVAECRPR